MEERAKLRWREEDLDEYEEEVEEDGDGHGYGFEEEGEEREEEEAHKPTQEELDYLKMREKLKDRIRQKYRKENGAGARGVGSSEKRRASGNNAGFGSFFGPSQPVIARRVIEESHSLRETQHITSKTPNSGSINKWTPVIANGERKIRAPKIVNEVKTKVEALKDMRDYSFLFSDDSDLPAPTKDPPVRNSSASNSTQAPPKATNRPLRPVPGGPGLKKPTHSNHQAQARAGLPKLSNESRSKHSIGSGPGRPPVQKVMSNASRSTSSKKPPTVTINKLSLERKSLAIRRDSSSKKQYQEQRREIQALPKAMVAPRQPTSSSKPQQSKPQQSSYSKPQQSKPQRSSYSKPHQPSYPSKSQQPGSSSNPQRSGYASNSQRPGTSSKPQQQGHSSKLQPSKPSKPLLKRGPNGNQLKRKPVNKYSDEEDEDDGAISMIRQMFRYNPNKYQDDDDDSDMEANFDDIMMEERRSSRIARKEDEEQLLLIEEEERQERMRKLAKKRRLG